MAKSGGHLRRIFVRGSSLLQNLAEESKGSWEIMDPSDLGEEC